MTINVLFFLMKEKRKCVIKKRDL